MTDPEQTGSERHNPNSVICVQIPLRDVIAAKHEKNQGRPVHLPVDQDGVVA